MPIDSIERALPRDFAGASSSSCTSVSLSGRAPPFSTTKLRLPMPSTRPLLSVALHAIEWSPFVSSAVSYPYDPIDPRPASRLRYFVGFDARGVNGACGVVHPKMLDTSSLQYTPCLLYTSPSPR